jgi:ABC-type multidrug transport system fused ATPase/permease subunit
LLGRLEARFLRRHRVGLGLGLIGLLAQSVLVLPGPLLQGRVVDQLLPLHERGDAVTAGERAAATTALILALGGIVACHLARAFLAWRVGNLVGRISQEVVVDLREALHRKLMRLPVAYFDRNQTGRLMARVTSDVGTILGFLHGGSLQLIHDLILALGIAVLLVWLQWRLALIALLVVPLYALNHKWFARQIHALSQEIRSQVAAIYALLGERVSAVRLVRAYAQEAKELEALDTRIDAHRALSLRNIGLHARLGLVAGLISGLGTAGVVAYGAVLVGRELLSMGDLLAFYGLVGQLYGPIVRLSQFQATAVATRVSVERLFEVLDEPETIAETLHAIPLVRPRGAIAFRDLVFRYHPDGPVVLDGIDLEIDSGMTVGIVGPSGAGKSTLLALIPRLYDPVEGDGGAVWVDGRDVRDLRLSDLRRAIALIPQQSFLFEGTIRSNLAYAVDGGVDEPRLRRALEIADLATTVDRLPLGLETPVGERGLTLSGGQRQRLALARAIAADPAVLLFDDCTSALDSETEARVQNALRAALPGRTRLIVSHKASSVRHADLIIVLDRGRIVERGTHEELAALGGWYATHYQPAVEADAFAEAART